eukprot:TRINITY_DN28450_c0_g1_i2.p2 TRINITY_DN28450_c0_g1~~TRINITY_DN28450_c0_g1_i2.p2  ORF type:complete len:282 (+),score=69.42 TRINITY_DN28450_c0_g1_i2:138-983(+)
MASFEHTLQALQVLDEEYVALRARHDQERLAVLRSYEQLSRQLRQRRRRILTGRSTVQGIPLGGTPAVPGFWRTVLRNAPSLCEVADDDDVMLAAIEDINWEWLDAADRDRGFRLRITFGDSETWRYGDFVDKVFYTGRVNDIGRLMCLGIQSTRLETPAQPSLPSSWPGCFFKNFLRTLQVPEDIEADELEVTRSCGARTGAEALEVLLEEDYEHGVLLRDSIVPHAVRYYTGQARSSTAASADDSDEERLEVVACLARWPDTPEQERWLEAGQLHDMRP